MTRLRPYGDTPDDGAVQLSFTLAMPWSSRADEAARRIAAKMGLHSIVVAEGRAIAENFSFFVIYGQTSVWVDTEYLPQESSSQGVLSMEQVAARIETRFRRKVRIAGACIGSDAHTVGIDAILNMKGYQGDSGLERYSAFVVYNLGSQIDADTFVRFVVTERVDVLLASQVVTQKGSDISAFTALVDRLEAEGIRDQVLLLCGGPRMTALLAVELGYDAGFGRGTLPSEVATFIATTPIQYGWS